MQTFGMIVVYGDGARVILWKWVKEVFEDLNFDVIWEARELLGWRSTQGTGGLD